MEVYITIPFKQLAIFMEALTSIGFVLLKLNLFMCN